MTAEELLAATGLGFPSAARGDTHGTVADLGGR